ncbi:MAG: CHAP domain-containing protein [Myxococcota bacterium]
MAPPIPTALLAACTLALCGCATGAPVGGRHLLADRYEPFTRPAEGRAIPAPVADDASAPLVLAPGSRESVVAAARGFLGKTKLVVNGRRFGDDCTGFVRAVFEPLGINLLGASEPGDNGVTAMWRFSARHGRIFEGGRPLPGDLVFFKETYDLNRDGHTNDGLTHIGIVEDVEADGTVLVIHRVARGVVRYRMNLANPTQLRADDGRRVNDWLRTEAPGSKPRLTAELFAGYATLLPVESSRARR